MMIIKEYVTKFPEILEAVENTYNNKSAMNSLFDLYPSLKQKNKNEAIANIKRTHGSGSMKQLQEQMMAFEQSIANNRSLL